MPPKRNRAGRRNNKFASAASWTQDTGSRFYPSNFMGGQPMDPYMQAAFWYGARSMLGMSRRWSGEYDRDYGYGYDYDYEDVQEPYFRGDRKRFDNRGFRGRNNRLRQNKRPNSEAGTSPKKPRTNNRQSSTPKEKDNGQEAAKEETSQDKSPVHGANAPSRDRKNANDSQSRYCTVCEEKFIGSFFNHRRNQIHRRNKDKKYPRCRLCRLTFSGVKEFDAHNESADHKKMSKDLRVLKVQKYVHAALSDSEDDQVSLQRYISNQEPDNISEDAEAVGQFHVIPLKVFFCKLCQKLFPSYMKGRHIHCRTPAHIQAYKDYFDKKEERAAEVNKLKQDKKKENALKRARLQKEKLAGTKEGVEWDELAEDIVLDEDACSDDDEEEQEKQDVEDQAMEVESELIGEEEQDKEAAEGRNAEEMNQEEVNNETSTDA